MTGASAPTGTVTFLFSDIEGSTRRWERDRAAMQDAVRTHDRLMREAIVANGGYIFKTMGDAFFAAFARPEAAIVAALDGQRALAATDFSAVDGLRVRMALNTGTADERDGDYFGPTLNFVARLLPLGHGGQVLLSDLTAGLVRDGLPPDATLADLGEHSLKDIEGYERVYQLVAPDLRRNFPELRSQHALQPWLVPDAMRTRYFTGRDAALGQLRIQLLERHRAALCGLGGVGKTQAAMEYAVRHRADYPNGVFWIECETVGRVTSGFVEIAKALQLPAAESNDQEEAVRAVLARLNRTDGWLLILDNVEERGDVRRFVPERDRGDVLITSRESVFAELGIPRGLDLGDLDRDDSVRFLLARAGHHDTGDEERTAAAELATEVGNLPLALEQAAAYVAETGATFANYLGAYRTRRLSLLEKSVGLVSRDTVAVTWAANFEAVERASPAAAEVLRLSTLLAPDAIPYELFLAGARALGGSIGETLADPDDLSAIEMLRPAARYSLVKVDARARVFSIHRLVQEIAAAALPDAQRRTDIGRMVGALDAAFPKVDYANWMRCERLVPHIASIARWVDDSAEHLETFGRVLDDAGQYLWRRGRYAEAQPLQERALAIREKVLGPDHPDVAFSLNNLAILHFFQGRFGEAQPLQERALDLRERALGPDHVDVAHSCNNLANLHYFQGRYAQAQALHERALAIREKALGPESADVASSLNNLAEIHSDRGRYGEAQLLHERALGIKEKALGPHHPSVASSLDNLAANHRLQGRYAEAQALHERALAILEAALGPNHPDVALSLTYLANAYVSGQRHAEAEPLYERALGIAERALGPDHRNLCETLVGLASVRAEQGRVAEAIGLYERALLIKERAYTNAGHPELTELRKTIAALYAGPIF